MGKHVRIFVTGPFRDREASMPVISMGHKLSFGNNISINLEPDTRAETQALYAKLLAGGSELMPLQDMFWGDLYGTGVDKYGVRWMFDCREPKGDA